MLYEVITYIREFASSTAYFNVERQFQFLNFYARLFALSILFSCFNIIVIVLLYFNLIHYLWKLLTTIQLFLFFITRLSGNKYQQTYTMNRKYAWNLFIMLAQTKGKNKTCAGT